MRVVNLYDPDTLERLRELKKYGLRNVKVKLKNSELGQIQKDDAVKGFGNLFNAGLGTDAVTIGIELGVGRSHKLALDPDIAAGAVELAEMGDQLESMIVRGRDKTGEIQTINMKKERLSEAIDVRLSASDKAVYQAIRDARNAAAKKIGGLDRAARGT